MTTTPDPWATIRALVDYLDAHNGHSTQERVLRVMKISEEAGEVAQAVIGVLGQNPRKGVSHSTADVTDELCDVIVSTMAALYSWCPDPARAMEQKIRALAERLGVDSAPPAICGATLTSDSDRTFTCRGLPGHYDAQNPTYWDPTDPGAYTLHWAPTDDPGVIQAWMDTADGATPTPCHEGGPADA